MCNDISPVTFSVSPALPCALYYWNNSQTPTTNNSFQITPDGHSNIVATVNIVYGTSNTNLEKTLKYQPFAPGVVPNITGNILLCSGITETYTVSNLRTGYTVTWSGTPNININTAGNSALINSNSTGTGVVHATVYSDCGSFIVSDLYLQIGTPRPGLITIDFDAPPRRFTASIDGVPFATSYKWYCDGVLIYANGTARAIFSRDISNCDHVYYIDVIEVNSQCGDSELRHAEVSEPPCEYLVINPNPGSANVQLSIINPANTAPSVENSYSVKIYDSYGILYSTFKKKGESFTVPVNNLKEGTYIVTVGNTIKNYSGKLLIKR